MKTIIAGSRSIVDYNLLVSTMKEFNISNITEVISGTARGPDRLGEQWALEHNIPIKRFYPDWNKFGRAAGIYRNADMRDYSDQAIILWDMESKGTLNMIDLMRRSGKPYYVKII